MALDNGAVALDGAIGQALNDDASGRLAVTRIYRRMKRRTTQRLLRTGEDSVAADELVSAASNASVSADSSDARGLGEARTDAQDARLALAEEFTGG